MIELEFAELHGPIFIAGTNLSAKLIPGDGPGMRRDIKLAYCRDERELYVHFKSKVGIVPRENVALMVEKKKESKKEARLAESKAAQEPEVMHEKITAQVDSPMHHVFAGLGHGKTGKDNK